MCRSMWTELCWCWAPFFKANLTSLVEESAVALTVEVWPHGEHMRIGILGSGLMGSKLGTIFARPGHDVIFSYSRTRQKLEQPARDAAKKLKRTQPKKRNESILPKPSKKGR